MTENLRLTGERALTPSDSNISSNWTLPAEKASDFDWGRSCTDTAYHMKSSADTTTYASYGNYYNWYAATAGTGTCTMTSDEATSSICPKGWRLPTGGSYGSGAELDDLSSWYGYSTELMQDDPAAFVLSGYRDGSSTETQGVGGFFWSSTTYYSTINANYLRLDSSYVYPEQYGRKFLGFAVRCIAQ